MAGMKPARRSFLTCCLPCSLRILTANCSAITVPQMRSIGDRCRAARRLAGGRNSVLRPEFGPARKNPPLCPICGRFQGQKIDIIRRETTNAGVFSTSLEQLAYRLVPVNPFDGLAEERGDGDDLHF